MEVFCGFDSKRFVRGNFQALLGVGVTTTDTNALKEKYTEILSKIFQEYNIPYRRPIYKAYDLKSIFMPLGVKVCQYFMQNIAEHLLSFDVYYSYFYSDGKDQEFIDIYYAEPTGVEKVNAIKLLSLLENAYPAICAWKYLLTNPNVKCHAYVDQFKAKPSKLLMQIKDIQNIHTLYSGDKCNYLISTADLLLSALEEQIKEKDIALNRQMCSLLDESFPEKYSIDYLGKRDLYHLVPSNKLEIDFSHRVKHPIYFIFTEDENFTKVFKIGMNERDFVEKSKFYDALLKEASEKEGCLKFFEPNDQIAIKEEDVFFHYGNKGLEKIRFLESLGFNNRAINYELLNKEKRKA